MEPSSSIHDSDQRHMQLTRKDGQLDNQKVYISCMCFFSLIKLYSSGLYNYLFSVGYYINVMGINKQAKDTPIKSSTMVQKVSNEQGTAKQQEQTVMNLVHTVLLLMYIYLI